MKLIAYKFRHHKTMEIIDLCGKFKTDEYWNQFIQRERERGWHLLPESVVVISEYKEPNPEQEESRFNRLGDTK